MVVAGGRRLEREDGREVNRVEAAGNRPMNSAAFEGWAEGVELLLRLGAKVNASNNAGAAVAAAVTAV